MTDLSFKRAAAVIAANLISIVVIALVYIKSNNNSCFWFCLLLMLINTLLFKLIDDNPHTLGRYITLTFINSIGIGVSILNCGDNSVMKPFILILLSAIAAAVFYCLFPCIEKKLDTRQGTIQLLAVIGGISLALYALLIAAPTVNGAKAWLLIAGFSIQLTEITKFLFLLALCITFGSRHFSISKQIAITAGFLCMNVIFLALICNEFGTAFAMIITYIIVQFLFTKLKQGIAVCLLFVALFVIGIMTITYLHDQWPTDSDNLIAHYVDKLYDRIYFDDTYQLKLALEGIANGGLFGASSDYMIDIPIFESDFAFANLCQRMGAAMGILVIAAFIYLIVMMQRSSEDDNRSKGYCFRYRTAYIFTVSMVTQTLVVLATNTGLLPIIGINMPFISEGGSQSVITYIMCIMIIGGKADTTKNHSSRKNKKWFEKGKTRKEIFDYEVSQ
jgi:cell division protein FtsW